MRAANAARRASSREAGRCQPTEEAPGQAAAIVENDARRDGLAISEHSSLLDHDTIGLNRIMISSLCLSMISGQTLRVCPEGKPVPTFPDHTLAHALSKCDMRLPPPAISWPRRLRPCDTRNKKR